MGNFVIKLIMTCGNQIRSYIALGKAEQFLEQKIKKVRIAVLEKADFIFIDFKQTKSTEQIKIYHDFAAIKEKLGKNKLEKQAQRHNKTVEQLLQIPQIFNKLKQIQIQFQKQFYTCKDETLRDLQNRYQNLKAELSAEKKQSSKHYNMIKCIKEQQILETTKAQYQSQIDEEYQMIKKHIEKVLDPTVILANLRAVNKNEEIKQISRYSQRANKKIKTDANKIFHKK